MKEQEKKTMPEEMTEESKLPETEQTEQTKQRKAKTYFAFHGHYASRNNGSIDLKKARWHITEKNEMPTRNPNTIYAAWFVFDDVKTFKTMKEAKAFIGEKNGEN